MRARMSKTTDLPGYGWLDIEVLFQEMSSTCVKCNKVVIRRRWLIIHDPASSHKFKLSILYELSHLIFLISRQRLIPSMEVSDIRDHKRLVCVHFELTYNWVKYQMNRRLSYIVRNP